MQDRGQDSRTICSMGWHGRLILLYIRFHDGRFFRNNFEEMSQHAAMPVDDDSV